MAAEALFRLSDIHTLLKRLFTSDFQSSATGEEWLDLIADILIMPEERPALDGQNTVIEQVDADADMSGEIIAQKIRERRECMAAKLSI